MTLPPRRASTICLVRPSSGPFQVLMVRRTETAPFMAGTWVFPGGALGAEDEGELVTRAVANADPEQTPWTAAALRELAEETGLWLTTSGIRTGRGGEVRGEAVFQTVIAKGTQLDGDGLLYFANWITPEPMPIRFDTRFYAAAVPNGYEPNVDRAELDDAAWTVPTEALRRLHEGDWVLPFPTRKTLESLSEFETVGELLGHIAGLESIEAVQPRIAVSEERVEILVPGESGFAEADPGRTDAEELMRRITEAVSRGASVPVEMRPR